MRDIEFRAWDRTNKVMVYNVNINDGHAVKQGYQWFNSENTVHNSDPEQYTGLLDKNGKKIFENDIVKYDEYYIGDSLYENGTGAIVFEDGSFMINDGLAPELDSAEIYNCNIELTGNIHE